MSQLEPRGFTRELSVHANTYYGINTVKPHTYTYARTGRAKKPVTRRHSLVLIAIFMFKAFNNGVSQLQASLF